jgi:hypothetical protein
MGIKLGLSDYWGQYRRRVFEHRLLRRIFGPKKEELARRGRKLHNKKLHKPNPWRGALHA